MQKDDENSIWLEVLQRLTKIETNTEGLNEISGIARTALAKSEENARDIEEMKENQKWAWRTIAGIGVTWERFGNGRVLVGVDEADSDFSTPNKTGGAKTHIIDYPNLPARSIVQEKWKGGTISYSQWQGGNVNAGNWIVSTPYDMDKSFGQPISNLQPYITVYMWRRTA